MVTFFRFSRLRTKTLLVKQSKKSVSLNDRNPIKVCFVITNCKQKFAVVFIGCHVCNIHLPQLKGSSHINWSPRKPNWSSHLLKLLDVEQN